MMLTEEKFSALLGIAIVPQVIDIITQEEHLSDVVSIRLFYQSETYALLEKEETKIWHYSPLTIYHIWKIEQETGKIVLPEEGVLA